MPPKTEAFAAAFGCSFPSCWALSPAEQRLYYSVYAQARVSLAVRSTRQRQRPKCKIREHFFNSTFLHLEGLTNVIVMFTWAAQDGSNIYSATCDEALMSLSQLEAN